MGRIYTKKTKKTNKKTPPKPCWLFTMRTEQTFGISGIAANSSSPTAGEGLSSFELVDPSSVSQTPQPPRSPEQSAGGNFPTGTNLGAETLLAASGSLGRNQKVPPNAFSSSAPCVSPFSALHLDSRPGELVGGSEGGSL